jgi:hypothetical protein
MTSLQKSGAGNAALAVRGYMPQPKVSTITLAGYIRIQINALEDIDG